MFGPKFVVKKHTSSKWFMAQDNELYSILHSLQNSLIEHFWDILEWEIHIIDIQPTNLQQLCDAIMEIWSQSSEECFQHLVNLLGRFQWQEGVQPLQKH